MAYSEFYLQTTGSNLNAGSTNADAASITQTNGSWDITADTFIATAGLPFATVNVGDWASIYNDGATVTPYIAQVTAVNSLGASITLSTTVKFGTKPAAGATGKSCKIGGAWADFGMTASGVALNTGTVPLSTRINVKAGTYANTTTSRTFTLAGAATTPLWWRGYNAAIGDLDADFTTAKPAITFTTGRFISAGIDQIYSNLSISGAQVTNGQVLVNSTSGTTIFDRCRIECTAANASGAAFSCTGATGSIVISRSWLKATSSAPCASWTANRGLSVANTYEGGLNGILLAGTGQFVSLFECFRSIAGDAIRQTTAAVCHFLFPSISSPAGDGFEFTVAPTFASIVGAIYATAGWGVNQSSGTNTALVFRLFNDNYLSSSGNETGFGDHPAFAGQTESNSPFVSTSDLSLVSGAVARQLFPGLFENESFTGYGDLGAVQAVAVSTPVGQQST